MAEYQRNVAPLRSANHEEGRYDTYGRVVPRKPDLQYLNALLRQGWNQQERQRQIDNEMTTLLRDEHELDLPDLGIESERFTGARAMELVLQIAQFWPNQPQITIPPLGGAGEAYEGFSDDLETGLNALLTNLGKAVRGPLGPLWDSVKKQVVSYGRGYVPMLPNPRSWRDYPSPTGDLTDADHARDYLKRVDRYAKGKLPPLQVESIPGTRAVPFFDGSGLAEAFWVTYDRGWEVFERCKMHRSEPPHWLSWLNEPGKLDERLAQRVPVIHYANRAWCAELVGSPRSFPPIEGRTDWVENCDMLVEPYPHWLEDRIPVAYFSGLTTPLPDEEAVVGVAWQSRGLIYGLDRLDSMKGTAVRTWAWPTPVLKTSLIRQELIEAGTDGRPRPIEIAPGLTVTLWGDEELSFLTYQGDGPDTELMIKRLEERFQQISLPSAESQSGDVSGYLYAQMRKSVRGKWGSISDGIARGWEDLAWIALEYIRRMPSPIYIPALDEIGWSGMGVYASEGDARTRRRGTVVRLDPRKLRQFDPFIHVVLEEDKSLDMTANAQTALALLNAGVPKAIVYPNVLGIQNYKQVRIMSWLEKLDDYPGYAEKVIGEGIKQGQIFLEDTVVGAMGAVSPDQLSPGMQQALAAGGVPPQPAMGMLGMGAPSMGMPPGLPPGMAPGVGGVQPMAAAAGAMAQGGLPPAMAPVPAAGALPGLPVAMGAGGGGFLPGDGAMPPMGGLPSPAVTAAPVAPRPQYPYKGMRGGRAAGQSRRPGGPKGA